MSEQHSPLPWRVTKPGIGDTWVIVAPDGRHIADVHTALTSRTYDLPAEANAELIVTAVNEHAELLARAERAEAALVEIVNLEWELFGSDMSRKMANIAEQALALQAAKGEQHNDIP